MILQCDQCNTKFKLDDSKIKDGGVKVRCSKCKHVFLVTKDSQDETDFDSILNGLDAPAPPPAATAAASAAEAPADTDVAAPQVDFSHLKHALQTNENETAEEPVAEAFDFGSFKFDDDQGEPAKTEAGEGEKSFDLSGFNPDAEAGLAVDAGGGTDDTAFGEGAVQEENRFEMSEFSFDDVASEPEPAVKADEPSADPLGYNDFSFSEEPPVSPAVEPEPAAPGEFDFSEFSFDAGETKDEQTATADEGSADANTGLDFGSFDFENVEDSPKNEPDAGGIPDVTDGADEPFASPGLEFDLTQESQPEQIAAEIPAAAVPDVETPGEFSFDFGTPEEPQQEVAPTLGEPLKNDTGEAEMPEFNFGDFTEEAPLEQEPEHKVAVEPPSLPAGADGGMTDLESIDFGPVTSPATSAEEQKAEFLFDDPAHKETKEDVPPGKVTEADFQDEYPPLSINSRRKGSSLFSFAGIGAVLLVLLVLAGTGLFFLKSKPEVFNKLGLGALAKGLGVKTAEDGHITVKNPVGSFIINKEAGELFVITGFAVNEYKKPRASIQVKAALFGKDGKPVMQKVVYCGNNLSREQLVSMPLDKLETAMNNQFGDSLSNLGVQPGKEIPFVVILSKVPQNVGEFGVEVVGSTVATQ